MEMSFGRWEGFTFAELQTREAAALAAREHDKWGFVLPGGESYAQLELRVGAWYESLERDSVVTAHGGVCRGADRASRSGEARRRLRPAISGRAASTCSTATAWRATNNLLTAVPQKQSGRTFIQPLRETR